MNKKFLKVFISMSFLLVLGKGLGFIRSALVASSYGAGFITDVYSFEDSLINEIYSIFSTFLGCTFIPKYLSLGKEGRNKLYSLLLNMGIIIMLLLIGLTYLFTRQVLQILVPGFFEIYDIELVIFYTRVNLVMLLLTFLVNYLLIVLQANEIFIYLSLESIILNVIVISYLFIMPQKGVIGLLLCRVVAYSILLLLVFYKIKKTVGAKYCFYLNVRDKDLVEMAKLSLPMLFVTLLWQVNYVIDRSMASGLKSGSIACLNYANLISMIIYNVIGYVVSTYAYPTISKVQEDSGKVSRLFKDYLLVLLQLVLPVSIMTMFFSHIISRVVYGHGNMSSSDVNIISIILVMYLPGSIAYCIKNLYSKLFYIKKDTKIVLTLDIVGCLSNIVLNIILINVLGVYGLALATSSASILTVVLQMIIANKRQYTNIVLNSFKPACLIIIVVSLVSYAANALINIYIGSPIIVFILVAILYAAICGLFGYRGIKKLNQSNIT